MPNELPTDRLPTIEETRAMHERAVRARKKKKLQKTLATAGLVLLALALAAALALFAREKLQTLDKPLDAKTAQTQPVPQEPDIPAAEPDPEPAPSPEPQPDPEPEIQPEPASQPESEPEPQPEAPAEKTYAPADVTDETKTLDLELYSENALLIDLESNTVLVQKNADALIHAHDELRSLIQNRHADV